MARVRSVSSYQSAALDTGWQLAEVPAGAAALPQDLTPLQLDWLHAPVPGTCAAALRAAGRWNFGTARNFDDQDVWYRCRFTGEPSDARTRHYLRLEGLATVAEVWLNGVPILRAENMYVISEVDVTAQLRRDNELYIVFRALTRELQTRRPRPRWRTRLVEQQQLRWFRTTLLGRMPGWCPPVAPVGPWRPVVLQQRRAVSQVTAQLAVDATTRRVRAELRLQCLAAHTLRGAELIVGDTRTPLRYQEDGQGDGATTFQLRGELRLPSAELWWPHTHGAQPL